MNIDNNINQIVQNIVSEITSRVQSEAMANIEKKVAEVIATLDTTAMLSQLLSSKLDEKLNRLPIDSKSIEAQLSSKVKDLASSLAETVQVKSSTMANEAIVQEIRKVDFKELCQNSLLSAIEKSRLDFPVDSIPASAVRLSDARLSGNNIVGGIIKNFGSTGIDDRATDCKLTVLDHATVVENNLVTQDLTVKGSTTIEGDLVVTGTVPADTAFYQSLVGSVSEQVKVNLDQDLFHRYSKTVYDGIRAEGLDLTKITVNGVEVINGGNLANTITFSNLQRVGTLQELRVSGESLLSQTLYTTTRRVGINTVEPTQVLSIWDQEIEIGIGKKETNVGVIEAPRAHKLVLSSNGKNNLSLMPDGSVQVEKISVGTVSLSSSLTPPSYSAPIGSIVFNANPTIGGPLGWVSLGDARWANFGIID
jgi:hypothetical protein